MYSDIKKVGRSKEYLVDAIRAVKDKEESRYFPEGLELVGVNLDSDFLRLSQVIADPYLSINLEDDIGITIDIRLKPESPDDPVVGLLELVLETTSTGMFMDNKGILEENKKDKEKLKRMSSLMMPVSTLDMGDDPEVALFFGKDSVELQRLKMVGEEYYAFSLTETAELDDELYTHTLNILFKESSSSYETFFSSFVGKKHYRRDSGRLLESISQNNITGFFVGGLSLKAKGIETITYALTSTGMIYDAEGEVLSIRTNDTSYIAKLEDLEYTEVRVNEAGKYTVSLNFKGDVELDIYMG